MKYSTFKKEYWFALDFELELLNASKEEWADITIEDYSVQQYVLYVKRTYNWKKRESYLKELNLYLKNQKLDEKHSYKIITNLKKWLI